MGKYDDILHLPRHVSEKRLPMCRADRAAQFSPFAALSGYDDTIQEAGRLTRSSMELGEDGIALVEEKLQQLARQQRPYGEFTWFVVDSKKSGGDYVSAGGYVKKIDTYDRRILLEDGTAIPLDSICYIE